MDSFLAQLQGWAQDDENIDSILLVGSHARGQARHDSDIDLVIICNEPKRLLADTNWIRQFGEVKTHTIEDWGMVQSIRAFYADGQEVEFGITSPQWAAIPVDEGTAGVVSDGAKIILDKNNLSQKLIDTVRK